VGQTVWTETACDRCGKLDRHKGTHEEKHDLPVYWVWLNTERHISTPGTIRTQLNKLVICNHCWDDFLAWMEPVKDTEEQRKVKA